jgi:hypothetical protein
MTISTDDRLAIHELISLHGHLADDGRADELDLLLTHDAQYDIEDFGLGVVVGLPALRELWAAAPGDQPLGHHVTNVVVTDRDGEVRVRSKGLSVMSTGAAGTVVYDDIVVKTADGWRISSRKVIARPSRATS